MTTKPFKLKGILLDLDGVIAETEDLHRQAYNLAFEEAKLPVEWSQSDYRSRLAMTAGSKLTTIEIPAEVEDREAFRKQLYGRKRSFYLHLLETAPLEPRPGILRLIDEATEQGVALGAASTCAKEGAVAILDRALGPEIRSRFKTVKAGNDVVNRKPAPDIYLTALEAIGLPSTQCIAIEDSLHGMQAAQAAGLWTLVTPSQFTRGEDFSQAELVVDDLESAGVDLSRLDSEFRKADLLSGAR